MIAAMLLAQATLPIIAPPSYPAPIPAVPEAPRWERVVEIPQGGFLIDAAGLRREGDVVRFHVRATRITPTASGVASTLVAAEMDCAARTIIVFSETSEDRAGAVLATRSIAPEERRPRRIKRDSPANAGMYRRLCGAELAE